MASLVEKPGVCIICCKNLTCSEFEEKVLANCWKLLLRQLGLEDGTKPESVSVRTETCQDCCILLEEYGQLYNDWKWIEMQLCTRIDKLWEIMRSADKVPSRVKSFSKFCQDNNGHPDWIRFRKNLKQKCKLFRLTAMPRVYVRKTVVKEEYFTIEHPFGINKMPIIYGWLASFLAVMMLSCLQVSDYRCGNLLESVISNQTDQKTSLEDDNTNQVSDIATIEDGNQDISEQQVDTEFNTLAVSTWSHADGVEGSEFEDEVEVIEMSIKTDQTQNQVTLEGGCNNAGASAGEQIKTDGEDNRSNNACQVIILESTFHRQNIRQKCDFCGEMVPRNQIYYHIYSHVGEYLLVCPNPSCGSVFSLLKSLKVHIKGSPVCNTFMTMDIDKCKICDERQTNLRGLRFHMLHVHEQCQQDKPYLCPVTTCSERFAFRQSVQSHILVHKFKSGHNPTGNHISNAQLSVRSYICEICEAAFQSKHTLDRHMSTHVEGRVKQFGCEQCSKRFAWKWGLKAHIKSVHFGARTYICHLCGAAFKTKGVLDRHKKVHV